jgi:hypothetical protein
MANKWQWTLTSTLIMETKQIFKALVLISHWREWSPDKILWFHVISFIQTISCWSHFLTQWCQNPQVHHHIYNSHPPTTILSQLNPLWTARANLPKIHSDPSLPFTSWPSKWSLTFWLSQQNPVQFSLLSHACYMPRPLRSPWFDLPNSIWGWVQNMKLLTSTHTRNLIF